MEWHVQRVLGALDHQMSSKLACTTYYHCITRPQQHLGTAPFVWERILHDPRLWISDLPVPSHCVGPAGWDRRWPLRIQSEEGASLLYCFYVTPVVELRSIFQPSLTCSSSVGEQEASSDSPRLWWRSSRYRLRPWPAWLAGPLVLTLAIGKVALKPATQRRPFFASRETTPH